MIYRILGALKIGWVIGTLLASSLFAAERPVPTRPIDPVPLTKPVEQQDAQSGGTQEAASKPLDTRPKIYLHMVHGSVNGQPLCPPCEVAGDWWIDNCDTCAFNIIPVEYASFSEMPAWLTSVPSVVFENPATTTGWEVAPWQGIGHLTRKWQAANPGRSLKPVVTASAPTNISGQAARYLGPSGTIVVTPAKPVLAVMEDGTRLTYSKLTCQYTVSGSDITLTLSPPLPEAQVRKFGLWFAAQILGGSTAEKDGKVTATVRTTKGVYRVDLTEVGQ
jgi:hypothetical protein